MKATLSLFIRYFSQRVAYGGEKITDYACAVGGVKLDYVEKAGVDWIMRNIQDAWVLWM